MKESVIYRRFSSVGGVCVLFYQRSEVNAWAKYRVVITHRFQPSPRSDLSRNTQENCIFYTTEYIILMWLESGRELHVSLGSPRGRFFALNSNKTSTNAYHSAIFDRKRKLLFVNQADNHAIFGTRKSRENLKTRHIH
ncbi:hypothetical protein TcasGA2_TC009229 [Tribolium castaneum]|uniref:Uncharacterized protein n=1 Tax=Tribolium castaneum TaxID=7070 RepID=D6WST7_TRICA|nr:hypothetical protein TcasGA2_TC009229 [Tribolium castaneum]